VSCSGKVSISFVRRSANEGCSLLGRCGSLKRIERVPEKVYILGIPDLPEASFVVILA
jgi:hypothetical protein